MVDIALVSCIRIMYEVVSKSKKYYPVRRYCSSRVKTNNALLLKAKPRAMINLARRAAESESESESAGVGSFDRSRSRSRLQHFFIISFLVKMETKMETEHYVLNADSHDGLPCTVLLALGLRLFPGQLAFNHTSRLDNHNRQRHSLWGQVTWPCLINFGRVNRLKKISGAQ